MNKALKKCGNWFKSIPWYGIFIGLTLTLGFQTLMYCIADPWIKHTGIFYGFDVQIPAIDGRIPLVPVVFVQFYLAWKIIFPLGAILSSERITQGKNKEDWINLMIAWTCAIFIGGMILIFCQTYIDRHNVAGVPGGDIYEYCKDKFSWSWRLLKTMVHEGDDKLYGGMPSFHCLNIIFCYLAVMRKKDKHLVYRLVWLFIALVTCASTVFCKQHYIVDIFLAVIITLIVFFTVKSFNPGAAILRKCPNFLIIKKLNWSHEKIYSKDEFIDSKKRVKSEK